MITVILLSIAAVIAVIMILYGMVISAFNGDWFIVAVGSVVLLVCAAAATAVLS